MSRKTSFRHFKHMLNVDVLSLPLQGGVFRYLVGTWGLLDDLDLIQDSSNRLYLVAKKPTSGGSSRFPLAAEQGAAAAVAGGAPPADEGAAEEGVGGAVPAAAGAAASLAGATEGGGAAASGAAENDDEYADIATFTAADRKQLQMGLELLRQRLQTAKLVGKGTDQGPAGAEGEKGGSGGNKGLYGSAVGSPPVHLVAQLRQNLLRNMKGKPPSVNVDKAGDPRQLFPPELVPYRKVRGRGGVKSMERWGVAVQISSCEALMLNGS